MTLVDLSYILGDTNEYVDYQLTTIKYLIVRLGEIISADDYIKNGTELNLSVFSGESAEAGELIYPLLTYTEENVDDKKKPNPEKPIIMQMDKSVFEFLKNIAKINAIKDTLDEKEYDNRISLALNKLNKSKPNKEVNSYCLVSVRDIMRIIYRAVEMEVKAEVAIILSQMENGENRD